jgi:hypothetical protein
MFAIQRLVLCFVVVVAAAAAVRHVSFDCGRMNDEESGASSTPVDAVRAHGPSISIEPDVRLTDVERTDLALCLSQLVEICHVPIVLNCTLTSSNSCRSALSRDDRESMRFNDYLRARQPRKFYWMRNIRTMYLHLRWPRTVDGQLTGKLVEWHSCRRVPRSARQLIAPNKPIALVYHIDERSLKLNIRGDDSLLQLFFPWDSCRKGVYYKWSDEGHVRSGTVQFEIDYALETRRP